MGLNPFLWKSREKEAKEIEFIPAHIILLVLIGGLLWPNLTK
jgi:hypothetical protein